HRSDQSGVRPRQARARRRHRLRPGQSDCGISGTVQFSAYHHRRGSLSKTAQPHGFVLASAATTQRGASVKVIVLGGGVIGVSTAYYLAGAGHQVTVIERQPGVGLETSFANAGEISPGYSSPWAAPGLPLKALKW